MPYQFKPSWLTSSLFLLLFLGFSGFGIWNINSPAQITPPHISSIIHDALEPLSLNMPFEEFSPYQRAQATGHYRAKHSILLDNISYQGKPGYHLITPFEIMASRVVILVNRGWLPKDATETGLPTFKTPEGLVTISGYLSHPQSKAAYFKQSNPLTSTPPLWHYLDLNFFSQINGYSVLPLILKLNPDGQTSTFSSTSIPVEETETSLIQDWQADDLQPQEPSIRPSNWFMFALITLSIYLLISFKKT